MNCKALVAAVFLVGSTFSGAAVANRSEGPMNYQEISLMLRSGFQGQVVLADTARRKLAQPLSPQQETALSSFGATPELLKALRSPALLVNPPPAPVGPPLPQQLQSGSAALKPNQTTPVAAGTPSVIVAAHFTSALNDAKTAKPITLQLSDAFSLSQLEQAKAKAVREKKPLGFIMVWEQFFGRTLDTRLGGGQAALIHFYQAFNNTLVLVFVRHESELGLVPGAVRRGFNGPDEGGYAPNMAVVDATARELIVEIPMGGAEADGNKRDQVFSAGALKITQWLATHPDAASAAAPKP